MIARIWHGWTTADRADAYEELLRSEVLPGIGRIDGYVGADLMRAPAAAGRVEFVTVTLWESLEAVHAFAGDDYEQAVVPPEARALLESFDERSRHYDVIARSAPR